MPMKRWLFAQPPQQLLVWGYLFILMIGFGLLCLPWFQTEAVGTLDALFVATSALSTTGLSTVDIGTSLNLGGEIVLLLLIQIGGLGYMSLGSFVVLLRRNKLTNSQKKLIKYDFSLPDNFRLPTFVRDLVFFTVLTEAIGAILLSIFFWQNGESEAIWKGIFHSVSAFCTAGFSLFSNSLVDYEHHFGVNLVISLLAIGGALGFIVFTDISEKIRGRKQALTFTSRIILRLTFAGMLLGMMIIFLSDGRIAEVPPAKRLMMAFFQSMTAFTTVGFNTYGINEMMPAPLFFLILLMVVGASPSGTGGGMKTTTLTALYAQLRCTFRGKQDAVFLHRIIPPHRLKVANSNFFFYVLVICVGTYLLLLVQEQPPFEVLFEVISALGTVGLSMGLTGELTDLGKIWIIVLMFIGRVGPLSLGIVLFHQVDDSAEKEEDLVI